MTLAEAKPLKKTKGRSRVTNNRSLWMNGEAIDSRSKPARRFRDILNEIISDLGGAERLSEGQRQIARRCAMLSTQCELMECDAIAGEKPFDLDAYGMLTDRLGRAFVRLGLKRVQKEVGESLADIVKRHAEERAARDAEQAETVEAAILPPDPVPRTEPPSLFDDDAMEAAE